MLKENETIIFKGSELLDVLKEINYILISFLGDDDMDDIERYLEDLEY